MYCKSASYWDGTSLTHWLTHSLIVNSRHIQAVIENTTSVFRSKNQIYIYHKFNVFSMFILISVVVKIRSGAMNFNTVLKRNAHLLDGSCRFETENSCPLFSWGGNQELKNTLKYLTKAITIKRSTEIFHRNCKKILNGELHSALNALFMLVMNCL